MIICGEKNWITADLPADAQGWVLPRSGLLEQWAARDKRARRFSEVLTFKFTFWVYPIWLL